MKPNYRRCISCRKVGLKEDFWRIVRVHPSGQVQLDCGMGRSAYICPQASCLTAAQKKNRLGRCLATSRAPGQKQATASKLPVSVPEGIYQILWQRLAAQQSSPACLASDQVGTSITK